MDNAAADYVKRALANLSSTTPSRPNTAAETNENIEDNEKKLLDININWEDIACLSDRLINNIPNNIS